MTKEKLFPVIAHWSKIIIVSVVCVLFIRGFVFIPVSTTGNSMWSTIHENDKVIMEKFTKIKRFDVVVIRLKDNKIVVKRIIALPEESIAFLQGNLLINDKKMEEPFLKENLKNYHSKNYFTNDFSYRNAQGINKLGNGKYFVMGDNRPNSLDSRSFDVIDETQILGVAIAVYQPLKHMRLL